jgi:hypothetical protein
VPDVHLNDCARESVFQEKSAVIRWLDLQVQFSWFEPRFDNVGRQARLSGSATILFLLNHNVCGFWGQSDQMSNACLHPYEGLVRHNSAIWSILLSLRVWWEGTKRQADRLQGLAKDHVDWVLRRE